MSEEQKPRKPIKDYLMDFEFVGEQKRNEKDGKNYILHYSTRFPPPEYHRENPNNNNFKNKNDGRDSKGNKSGT